MPKVYLIDGMSVVFRAYHAMINSNLKNRDGETTGAIFAFVNILTTLLEREKPEFLSIVFDTEQPTFRHEIYPLYKANRAEFPEELAPQLIKIKKFISLIGISQIEFPGFEADDIIGTLAKKFSNDNISTYCITNDKDYYQLVDNNIKLMRPGRGGEDFEIIDYKEVNDKFGVLPQQVIDVLALIGDTSDNVPGVKGIGEKTAIPLVQNFNSIEEIYNNLDKIDKESIKNKLINGKNSAYLAKELVTIKTDVPIDYSIENIKVNLPNFGELDKYFAHLNFNQIREKWRRKAESMAGLSFLEQTKNNNKESLDDNKVKYYLVAPNKLKETIDYLTKYDCISFDLETDSLDRENCEVVGISLSGKENEAFYLPIAKQNGSEKSTDGSLFSISTNNEEIEDERLIQLNNAIIHIKALLESKKIGKCGQNIKFDAFIMKRFGVSVSPIIFDSMVADYLINPDNKHGLDALSERWLNYTPIPISSLIGEKKSKQISMRQVDIDVATRYACEDADLALKLKNILQIELIKNGITKLANEVEFPLIEVLTDMEHYGVKVDTQSLAETSDEITKAIDTMAIEIYELAGEQFNIDSPKQLGFILFERLQIPGGKKTKTGYSTDVAVLSDLAHIYPIAAKIIEYRQLAKLKSTYLDALPMLVNKKTGRIHTSYNQTVVSTGRLSSTDPNLQNIPIRTDKGRIIRKGFIPTSSDNIIISADYSQIELRVMAHISDDTNLIQAFADNLDIHSATAAILNNVPLEEVTSEMRRRAKTVNFGILYGLGSFGLAQRLGIARNEASDIIKNYFKKYPNINQYINSTIELARKQGYVETLLGRRRYFPDINNKNNNIRTAAERAAINMPIQGTASDMIKIAMVRIFKRLGEEGLKTRMIMQVHDELVFDAPRKEVDIAKQLIEKEMTQSLPLGKVPTAVEIGIGYNWLEAH